MIVVRILRLDVMEKRLGFLQQPVNIFSLPPVNGDHPSALCFSDWIFVTSTPDDEPLIYFSIFFRFIPA
jgi:hypothetical protein